SSHAIVELDFAGTRQFSLRQTRFNILLRRPVEYRRGEVQSKLGRCPSKMRFKNLPDVHTRWNTERIQDDLYRRAIRQIGHVFFGNDSCNNALVPMPSGHLVAN